GEHREGGNPRGKSGESKSGEGKSWGAAEAAPFFLVDRRAEQRGQRLAGRNGRQVDRDDAGGEGAGRAIAFAGVERVIVFGAAVRVAVAVGDGALRLDRAGHERGVQRQRVGDEQVGGRSRARVLHHDAVF